MAAALRILLDVAVYRLRRLEMANLAAVLAIMLVLRLEYDDVAVRFVFAALLNLLAYLNNDYCDVARDAQSSGRDAAKTAFLREHLPAARAAQLGVAAVLAGIALWWSPGMLVALVAGAGVCWVYSAVLKQRPYVDVAAMVVWGAAMVLVAFPLDSTVGWLLALQLGLISGVFEAIQVIRDREDDANLGLRTTAVVLGVARTLTLVRVLVALAAAYMVLVLHVWVGLLAVLPITLSLAPGQTERYWHRVRLAFGLLWLAIGAWIYVTGSTAGALFSVDVGARIAALQ